MKKVKYYYSDALHIRTISVVTNAEGDVLYIPNAKPIKMKAVPRITVAAVWDTKTNKMYFGSSICAAKDNFKKSVGREIALKRANQFPQIEVQLTKTSGIRAVSKRYANELIKKHLSKYVRPEI